MTAIHVARAPQLQRRHQTGEDPEHVLRVEPGRLSGGLQLRRRRRDRPDMLATSFSRAPLPERTDVASRRGAA